MALLEVQHITKKFSSVTALDQVSMQLSEGKVTVLIGENGAGKSTLLKIMSGIHTDFEGSILYRDQEVRFSKPRDAQDAGISIIHQELNLIPYLTVAQNIFLGRELTNILGLLDEDAMYQQTKALLERLQLDVRPDALVSTLKVGQQQIVEIAKALLDESEVLFMDEPTSAIGESEVNVLFELINKLKKEGKAIVYISHKLDELFTLADHYVVLRDGKMVGQGEMKSIDREQLIDMMAGRRVNISQKIKSYASDEVVLEAKKISLTNPNQPQRPLFQAVNFQLKKGEVLGVYGLMGAGRTELCESLFGLHAGALEGEVIMESEVVKFKSPIDAIENGIALVPEDRKQDSIVPELSVSKNMSLTNMGKIERAGVIIKSLESKLYHKHASSLHIKADNENQLIKNLSGGNQQKVILAKWIERNPKVLILDEPTRGIDINAKNEIYQLMSELAKTGIAILVVSSEIPEIMTVADRILVMAEGRVSAVFERENTTEKSIMNACIPENLTV